MPTVYDQHGNAVGATTGNVTFHRYVEQLGSCGTCGRNRYDPLHFNGDGEAARIALEQERKNTAARNEWLHKLSVGQSIVVADDHPKSDLQGMVGRVTGIERQGPNKPIIATIKFPHTTLSIKSQWLRPVPLPEPPPKFASQEEADRWLEDTAKEMGIKVEPEVPRFASVEDAEEWMRRQQGEPYVPPSWVDTTDFELDQRMLKLLQDAIPPAGPNTITQAAPFDPSTLNAAIIKNRSGKGVRGVTPQGVYMDEAAAIQSDDDVVDPYT